jgi:hypothetical protein
LPGETTEPTSPRRTLPPYEPGGNRQNNTGPTGEYDPPPTLPFGPGPILNASPVREANRLPALPPRADQESPAEKANSSDDPPPALPSTLANLSN